jgi:hypothetical protein
VIAVLSVLSWTLTAKTPIPSSDILLSPVLSWSWIVIDPKKSSGFSSLSQLPKIDRESAAIRVNVKSFFMISSLYRLELFSLAI